MHIPDLSPGFKVTLFFFPEADYFAEASFSHTGGNSPCTKSSEKRMTQVSPDPISCMPESKRHAPKKLL